ALERELEPGRRDDRLRVQRGLAAAHLDVVAVEGDVDGAELDLDARELGDQPAQALRERDAARVDADEREPLEVGVALDQLVRDPLERPRQRICVEEHALFGARGRELARHPAPFRPRGTELKGVVPGRESTGGYRTE